VVKIEVPEEIYHVLKKEASRKNKDILQLLIEKLIVDPRDRALAYMKLHEKYLSEAEDYYKKGDLVQASEKYWGAICSLLNAIAELKGWEHYTHRDYNIIINNIARELGDVEIFRLFAMCKRLHANFYHNFLDKDSFKVHREDALKLVEILKEYVRRCW